MELEEQPLPTHPELVANLAKPGEDIIATLTHKDFLLWRLGSRAITESAHLFDSIKRQAIYRKSLNRGDAVKAFAALTWVLSQLGDELSISRAEIDAARAAFDAKRNPESFDDPAVKDALTPEKAHVWHMASCIGGEAGELMEGLEGWLFYGEGLDRANLVEELGDGEFYPEGLRAKLGITRDEVLMANILKLCQRYKGGTYSDKAAQERADKHDAQPVQVSQS